MTNLVKVHTWSFATGIDGYVVNQNVELKGVCDAIRVTSRQSSSTPGIKRNIAVQANTNYILSVKGYASRKNAFLWAMDTITRQRLINCYKYLSCTMDWVSYKFNTGNCTSIDFGVLFTTPKIGDFMVLAEFEIVRCDVDCCATATTTSQLCN